MGYIRIILSGLAILGLMGAADAMITDGACTGTSIAVGSTCQAAGFRLSDAQTNVTIKLVDIDSGTPHSVWIQVSAFWDNYLTFNGEAVGLQVGQTYTYTNPNDANDFVQISPTSIFSGGDSPFAQFDINYQQTSYVKTTGSDSANGNSPATAWATINKSAFTLIDGEDVIVSTGTYYGFYNTIYGAFKYGYSGNGLVNSPIIFKGDGSFPVITTAGSGYYADTVEFGGANYIDFSGFSINGTSAEGGAIHFIPSGASDIYGLKIHDNMITAYGTYYGGGVNAIRNQYEGGYSYHNYEIYNNIIYNSPAWGLIFAVYPSGSDNYIYNNVFKNNTYGVCLQDNNVFLPSKSGVGNYYTDYTGVDMNGDKIGDSVYNTCYNNDNYPQMDRESGYVTNNSTLISNATVYQSGATYRNTTTDANGHYNLSTVGRDTVTLIGNKSGYSDGNVTVNYNFQTANITLTQSYPPVIISWGNDLTGNSTLNVTAYGNEPIKYNATANQSVTWNWYKDGTLQGNNFDNYTTAFPLGLHTISVNGNNSNGITNTVTWNIISIAPASNLTGYVTFLDVDGSTAPLPGAVITINDTLSTTTYANGYYAFPDMGNTTYTATASANAAFNTETKTISASTNPNNFRLEFSHPAISSPRLEGNFIRGTFSSNFKPLKLWEIPNFVWGEYYYQAYQGTSNDHNYYEQCIYEGSNIFACNAPRTASNYTFRFILSDMYNMNLSSYHPALTGYRNFTSDYIHIQNDGSQINGPGGVSGLPQVDREKETGSWFLGAIFWLAVVFVILAVISSGDIIKNKKKTDFTWKYKEFGRKK